MGDVGDYWREHREYLKTRDRPQRSHADTVLAVIAGRGSFQINHYRMNKLERTAAKMRAKGQLVRLWKNRGIEAVTTPERAEKSHG